MNFQRKLARYTRCQMPIFPVYLSPLIVLQRDSFFKLSRNFDVPLAIVIHAELKNDRHWRISHSSADSELKSTWHVRISPVSLSYIFKLKDSQTKDRKHNIRETLKCGEHQVSAP